LCRSPNRGAETKSTMLRYTYNWSAQERTGTDLWEKAGNPSGRKNVRLDLRRYKHKIRKKWGALTYQIKNGKKA